MSTFRLAAVLRVRRVQEEQARAAVGAATAAAARAEEEARTRAARVASRGAPVPGPAAAFLVEVATRLRLAADAAEAHRAAGESADAVPAALAGWSAADARCRPLERLAETHAAGVRAGRQHAEQVALDDLAGAAWQRARTARAARTARIEEEAR